MYRDGARKSIWQEEVRKFSTETDLNSLFDVAIIGGGITGVSTALKLQESGKNVFFWKLPTLVLEQQVEQRLI
ncbi:hypothetical protein BOQ60_08570 [Chryseobacterium sp. CH1]|nr:hypothetical protein BOQ60_08570 [Chryseobacterium sp. CH1]